MQSKHLPIGTVVSDNETPTYELVRIKLKADVDVRPGELIRIPLRDSEHKTLIARVRSAYEHNPNEQTDAIAVRDTLAIQPNYPREQDSTIIYRQVTADLIEELIGNEVVSPQTLPRAGSEVFAADQSEIVRALGLETDRSRALLLADRVGTAEFDVLLKRECIQRHFFVCGTTGSGKSYAVGVLAEELVRQGLPVVFIDTQDEYAEMVQALGGRVVDPGRDFTIRVSSLTEAELLDLLPEAMQKSPLQCDIVTKAFAELETDRLRQGMAGFGIEELMDKIEQVAPLMAAKPGDVPRVTETTKRRTRTLLGHRIFGDGVDNWPDLMRPCIAIRCKRLRTIQLQSVATAVLRELQNLRLAGEIPPYVAVIDEAHLFVPEGQDSACKQIIREGVRIGRHHGICLVLLTQSPVDIDKRTIRQCNTRLVFALEPDQLDAIRGVKADATEEMLRSLPKMPRGTCLLSGTYESVRHAIPVHIRTRETPEGGKAPDIFEEMRTKWSPGTLE